MRIAPAFGLCMLSYPVRALTMTRSIFMILSPAKTLDFESSFKTKVEHTKPECSAEKTAELQKIMQSKTEGQLKKLLGISDNLAAQTHAYWNKMHNEKRPAIFAFSGQAYQGLQIHEVNDDAIAYLQSHLRIIDPYYGALRPMDEISPYRLEMATKSVLKDTKMKLADYWRPAVTESLAKDMKKDSILLNLASDEYSAAVDPSELHGTFVKVVFRHQGRVTAVHAKRARGLMTRYVAENNLTDLDEVKNFDVEGYAFIEKDSDDTTLVFDRDAAPPKKKPRKK